MLDNVKNIVSDTVQYFFPTNSENTSLDSRASAIALAILALIFICTATAYYSLRNRVKPLKTPTSPDISKPSEPETAKTQIVLQENERIQHIRQQSNLELVTETTPSRFALKEIPPADGIKMGLRNVNAKTCWLNSVLKYIASTDYYDGLFAVDIDTLDFTNLVRNKRFLTPEIIKQKILEQKELHRRLRDELREVVIALRQGTEGSKLDENLYLTLLLTINDFLAFQEPRPDVFEQQFDSAEFLMLLMNRFSYPSEPAENPVDAEEPIDIAKISSPETKSQYVQCLDHYRSQVEGIVKYVHPEKYVPQLVLDIPDKYYYRDDLPIIVPNILSESDQRYATYDFIYGRDVPPPKIPGEDDNQSFLRERVIINAPATLHINLLRLKMDPSDPTRKIKCDSDIDVDSKGLIYFIEYDPKTATVNSEWTGTECTEGSLCVYQMEAAIRHIGGANGGHYICYERSKDGTIRRHNDGSTSEISASDAIEGWQQAQFFRLKLIMKGKFHSKR